jgi:hypothetical protein
MIKPRTRAKAPQAPLTRAEIMQILEWQKRMYWFYGIAMVLLCIGAWMLFQFSEVPWVGPLLIAMIIALMLAGAYVQFQEQCPRCRGLLGQQARFALGKECKFCGVQFPQTVEPDQGPRA